MSNHLPAQSDPASLPSAAGDATIGPWEQTAYSANGDGEKSTAQLQRYLAAVARHKWWIVCITVLGTVGGVLASRFAKPNYVSQTTLWVEIGGESPQQGPIRAGQLLQSTAWIELLKSFVVLDHVVKEERLYVEASSEQRGAFATFQLGERFRPGSYRLVVGPEGTSYTLYAQEGVRVQGGGIKLEEGAVGNPIGSNVGFLWTPTAQVLYPSRELTFRVLNPRDVAVALAGEIRTSMQEEGNFLRLSLAGTDAKQITATLNTLAERYVEVAAQLKRAKLDELTTVLDEQRRYAEENLREAEIQLEGFRVQTITLPSDQATPVAPGLQTTSAPVLSRFFDMKIEREQLRSDREAIERILAQAANSSLPLDALMMIPSVNESPALKQALDERTDKRAELRALQQRYTSDYRPVQQLAERIRDLEQVTIPRFAMELRAQLLDREAEMEGRVASASGEIQQIPPRMIEEARLQRRVATAENLHGTLKQRYEEARLAAASTIPDIRVLDKAVVPSKPLQDSRMMLILFGFVGGLGASICGILVLDRFDPRVRYPEQVAVQMGLPILGVVPDIQQVAGGSNEESTRRAAEAFRELRLSLMHAHGTAGPLLTTITSAESGDGKSFVTSNLAVSFADQGYRTLVIDADVRRGGLHRIFGGIRTPGLTDFLAGTATQDEIIQEASVPSVYFIGSGTRMQSGPELLGSQAMSQLLLRLRSQFGVILLDSPPLGAGVDAYGLGTLTRNLVIVVRTGITNRSFAEAKLSLLDRLPIRILGAVLNGTPASKIYRDYSYLAGYEAQDEVAAESVTSLSGGGS